MTLVIDIEKKAIGGTAKAKDIQGNGLFVASRMKEKLKDERQYKK